ncbi:MAG: zf-HC2 domain-containing protein [Planctomycetaceae bacterium]
MDCQQAQSVIGSWIDREIEPGEGAALEAHLSTCASCHGIAEAIRAQDASLRRAFQPGRERASRLADRVVANLATAVPLPMTIERSRARNRAWSSWMLPLLTAAIGFLLAVFVLRPSKSTKVTVDEGGQPRNEVIDATPVAQLVMATGGVEFSVDRKGPWQPVPATHFACPSDAAIRTHENVKCELVTTDGCVLRMNGQTEITLRSPRTIELDRGQIWCRSPNDVLLEVRPSANSTRTDNDENREPTPVWCCTTTAPSSLLAAIERDGKVQVTAAGGEVSVATREARHQLKRNETATISGSRFETRPSDDSLLSTSWIQPLLIGKGHADAELSQRVDDLLAQIGRTKMSMLYEDQIRSLGEYCVLPLVRYVESPISLSEAGRRQNAMRIISDLAPPWAVGDLIELLRDSDAETRVLSASALQRLTGYTQGCPPEKWRAPAPESEQAFALWQRWWDENGQRFPSPVPQSPKPPPMMKARIPER